MRDHLVIHANPKARQHIDSGKHRFVNQIRDCFETRGFGFSTGGVTTTNRQMARLDGSYHMFDIDGAIGPNCLNFRSLYFQPFWSIEKAGMRHRSRLGFKAFNPVDIGPGPASNFFKIMQSRHLVETTPNLANNGFAFVPLQAKLDIKRIWQYADAITMVKTIRTHDPNRPIVLKLHPKVAYSNTERALVSELLSDPQIHLETASTHSLLAHCAYVVTQNSAAAFEGILHRKPAILFANTDFHHIFETVCSEADAAPAFAKVLANEPPYEKYLFWFLRLNCANAANKSAEAKIVEMVNEAGWELPH